MEQNETVADFEAEASTGGTIRLSELLQSGPVALFFYPKAFTPGCTAQSCRFRDLHAEFSSVGATPVGISSDSVETQYSFAAQNRLHFPILSDEDGLIAKQFGVKRTLLPFDKRTTFVIDTDLRVIEKIASETDMDVHADRALEVLKQRQAASASIVVPELEMGAPEGRGDLS